MMEEEPKKKKKKRMGPRPTDQLNGAEEPSVADQRGQGWVRPQPAAAERAATTRTTRTRQQPHRRTDVPKSGRCGRRGAAFLALFSVGGRRGGGWGRLLAIFPFSLEILAPPPPVTVDASVCWLPLLSWARSVPTGGDVIGRVVHSRRFEEIEGRERRRRRRRSGRRVDVDLDLPAFAG